MSRTRILVACLAWVLFAASSNAQPANDLSVSATFGWQGTIPGDRWSPITVQISPGQSPLAGTVSAIYQQGGAEMRSSVPFAATPNAATTVHLMAWIPELCMRVELQLVDETGRQRWRQVFDATGVSARSALPGISSASAPLILSLGRSTLPESLRDWPPIVAASDLIDAGSSRARPMDSAWTHFSAARGDAGALPPAWVAYDALAAIVVNPDPTSTPDPRAVEAIHTWVASGGRLIIRSDDPGDLWRQWTPPELASLVTIDSPRVASTPDEARAAISAAALRLRRIQEAPDSGAPIPGASGPLPMAADQLPLRFMRAANPWRPIWSSQAGASVLEAPHGFGAIVLMGFDPGKATTVLSAVGAGAVWRAAMDETLADALADSASVYTPGVFGVPPMQPQSAVNVALEQVARVPGVGTAVFAVIVACVFALGIMVGPVDFFALRKLGLLQRSWLTALIWVALAAAGAFIGPRLVRTEATRINRVSMHDIIADPAKSTSFLTGISGFYAGEEGTLHLDGVDRASWWRAASPRYVNYSAISASGLTPISQRAAGGAEGSRRGGPLIDLPMAIWTFRTFADDSNPPTKITGRVRPVRGGWSVLLSGLPDGAQVKSAALRVDTRWVTMKREARVRTDGSGLPMKDASAQTGVTDSKIDAGVWAGMFPEQFADAAPPAAWSATDQYGYYEVQPEEEDRPGVALRLPGPTRRAKAIESLLAKNSHAALYVEVSGWPVDLAPRTKFEASHTRILRVVLPLQQD